MSSGRPTYVALPASMADRMSSTTKIVILNVTINQKYYDVKLKNQMTNKKKVTAILS
jgi:hypothetical protein